LTQAIRPALPISAVAVSKGTRQMALGTTAGEVALLTVSDGSITWLRGHTAEVAALAFSPEGLSLVSASRDGTARVWDVTSGQPLVTFGQHSNLVTSVAFSPDGRRVAMAIEQQGDSDIWIYDLVRGTFARVTSEQSNQLFPVWSTDGRTVFYVNEQPLYQIYRRAADLSTPAERVLAADGDVVPTGTTADGKYLIYQRTTPTTSQDLWRRGRRYPAPPLF
jgi:WD40 repeat protein